MSLEKNAKSSSDDLSHLSEDQINEILQTIPSENSLRSDTIISIPSEDGLTQLSSIPSENPVSDEGVFNPSAIRKGIPVHSPTPDYGGRGEEPFSETSLDTKKLMTRLEALVVSEENAKEAPDLALDPITLDGSTSEDVGTRVKGFFQDLSSMWNTTSLHDDEKSVSSSSSSSDGEESVNESETFEWSFDKVETEITTFINSAISKGTQWIETSAAELAHAFSQ